MNPLQLLPIGDPGGGLVDYLGAALAAEFRTHSEISETAFDPEPAFHVGRRQYSSTQILARIEKCLTPGAWRLLAITSLDLYIPILTFVFGEAQLNGPCAVVSTHRLRQEFYGLPPEPELLCQRLLKESVHELGHTLALSHCENYRCAMAPSHAVEWIDLKSSNLCLDCRARALAAHQLEERSL